MCCKYSNCFLCGPRTTYIDLCVGRTWKKSSYCEHYFELFALKNVQEILLSLEYKFSASKDAYIYIFVLL